MTEFRRRIAVITTSRADYSHLYWPLRLLAADARVDLKLIVMAAHLSPEFGATVTQVEQDGFALAARIECLLSSDSDVGMDLKLIVMAAHLSPEFGATVTQVEQDGFALAARIECLLSSDSDVGMAKTIGLATLSLADSLGE